MSRGFALVLGICLALASASEAAVRAAKVFGDNMVLQQELPIAVWGWANAGEQVTVRLADKSAEAKAGADGAWRVDVPAMQADGKQHTLTITGPSNTVEFKGVELGEVWLASGQSNMSRSVEIKANTPGVRVFLRSQSEQAGPIPVRDDYGEQFKCTWSPAAPEALKAAPPTIQRGGKLGPHNQYGEVAYVFARTLNEALKVPVGVMNIAWGGSTAEAWTPKADIEKEYPFGKPAEGGYIGHRPGLMYQSQLLPIVPLTIRGVIWYQGEDDGRNKDYARDLTNLIESWRRLWGRPDMPFYFVQIAQTGYASGMLGVYAAQVKVMETVPNTGLAVSNDIYDGDTGSNKIRLCQSKDPNDPADGLPIAGSSNPHPPHKDLVAGRLARIALVKTYGQPARPIFGPIYESGKVEGDKIVVKLKYAYDGLKTQDGNAPNWFQVSDGTMENRKLKFVKADAKIVGKDAVEVWSPQVKQPRFVRFAWDSLAKHNLVNSGDLPAVSFRTDE
jgi:sialate O-acetylesterase